MTRGRLLVLNVVALVTAFAALWLSTAYVADALDYQRQLGPPALTLGSVPVYPPWAWISWDCDFGSYAPAIFRVARSITYGTASAVFLIILTTVLAIRGRLRSTSHGSARWATDSDLRMAGLLARGKQDLPRIVLCQTDGARFQLVSDRGPDLEDDPGRPSHHARWTRARHGVRAHKVGEGRGHRPQKGTKVSHLQTNSPVPAEQSFHERGEHETLTGKVGSPQSAGQALRAAGFCSGSEW